MEEVHHALHQPFSGMEILLETVLQGEASIPLNLPDATVEARSALLTCDRMSAVLAAVACGLQHSRKGIAAENVVGCVTVRRINHYCMSASLSTNNFRHATPKSSTSFAQQSLSGTEERLLRLARRRVGPARLPV
jgi:hypothetical protein